jgi:hypothetical protein
MGRPYSIPLALPPLAGVVMVLDPDPTMSDESGSTAGSADADAPALPEGYAARSTPIRGQDGSGAAPDSAASAADADSEKD